MRATLLLLLLAQGGSLAGADDCVPSRGRRLQGDIDSRCETLQHDGRKRSYRLYVPARLAAKAPDIFVLHGGGGSGSNMEIMTRRGFNRIADRDGAIVLYPDAVERNWNDGRGDLHARAVRENVDDVGFLKLLLERVAERHPVDRQRVFATGISNGGFMSYRLACDAAETFAALAPVVAGLSADLGPRCQPARPVSIAIINGTEDRLVPWNGGEVGIFGMRRGVTWSAMRTYDTWVDLNRCRNRRGGAVIDAVADDGTSVVVHEGTECAAGVEVRLYEVRGGGHNWPHGAAYLGERIVGRITRELDGCEEIWQFFRRVPGR